MVLCHRLWEWTASAGLLAVSEPDRPFRAATSGTRPDGPGALASSAGPAAEAGRAARDDTPHPGGVELPRISLPVGGGAVRGIDEKLTAGQATGAASLSVPVAVSPGRQGFAPSLTLHYDSGTGNGPFGIGWTLAAPAITRKTARSLPCYRDAEDSDVFILWGSRTRPPLLTWASMRLARIR